MRQITNEDIKKVMESFPKDVSVYTEKLLVEFAEEQPALFYFLNSRTDLNKNEIIMLVSAGQVAWFIIKNVLDLNPELSWVFIHEISSRNSELYNERVMSRDTEFSELNDIFQSANHQGFLMTFLMSFLFNLIYKQGDLIRDEMVMIILTHVKTAVDCLILDEDEVLDETCEEEYSIKSFHDVQESVMKYIDEFMKTPFFMKLTDYEKEKSVHIISTFSEIIYNDFFMLPLHWNSRRAYECVSKMAREANTEIEYVDALEPVLMPFLVFCGEKGYVTNGNKIAKRLACLS